MFTICSGVPNYVRVGKHVNIMMILLLCVASRFHFNFFRVRFCVDGRGAAAGLGLVEDRHDFETESTTRKMQVGKKGTIGILSLIHI